MNRPPDFIRFEGGVVRALPRRDRIDQRMPPLLDDGSLVRLWSGPWPPPERMGIAIGKTSGYISVYDPGELTEAQHSELPVVADVTIYRRESASQLPDDLDHEHVARGALYRPEETP
jgi:hypothetical protein